MSNNILDSLNETAEKIVGKTKPGKSKKRSLPLPVRDAHKKWRQCEQDLAECIRRGVQSGYHLVDKSDILISYFLSFPLNSLYFCHHFR